MWLVYLANLDPLGLLDPLETMGSLDTLALEDFRDSRGHQDQSG